MVATSSVPNGFSRFVAPGFAMGLLLALSVSGGIAGERITRGSYGVALLANAMMTAVALVLVVFTMRRVRLSFSETGSAGSPQRHALLVLASQVVGAAAGVIAVHVLLRREALSMLPWLSESPAQLVNDAVAVAGFLALVWASVNGLDARLLVLAFLGLTLYRATAPMWHLDHAPGGFHTSVQELVVAQLVAAALALGLFRTATARADR
jgi:hypothetical protein